MQQRAVGLDTRVMTMPEKAYTREDHMLLHGPYVQVGDEESRILHPPVATNNFEIKSDLITMIQQKIQFHGLANESPREHVKRFLELLGGFKINGVPEEAIRLRLSPYSLSGKAQQWLNNRPTL
ncbi:unnamed protein product [Linum trigynum]|uniref:Uncharacterized protein n=1 Tax=Linum trigynum TaxID=586398 RepID=A0AAV2D949_9ROSI